MNRCLSAAVLSLALAGGLALGAQGQEVAPTFLKIEKPAAGTPILVAMPETHMALLTTAGAQPKEEWSQNARIYLSAAVMDVVKGRSYEAVSVDPTAYEGSRDLQILKLNDAVTSAIQYNTYVKLPTKTRFDWTVGDGAAELRPDDAAKPAAYILFLSASGNYSSGGRMMMGAIMAAASGGAAGGALMAGGSQSITATLVDLNTGKIVWYRTAMYGGTTDLRTQAGEQEAVVKLFKDLPL